MVWLQRMKDANAHLTRWCLRIQQFTFTVEHRKGKAHTNADFLSWQNEEDIWNIGDLTLASPGGDSEEEDASPSEEAPEDLLYQSLSDDEEGEVAIAPHEEEEVAILPYEEEDVAIAPYFVF